MGFLMNLISGKTVEKIIGMAGEGADALHYSKEEEGAFKLSMLKAMGPQSVARRFLAFGISIVWGYLVLLAVHLYLIGYEDKAKFVFDVLKDIVTWPFLTAWGFYFLANVVRANKK